MAIEIDLNCDMGESFGIYKIGNDEEMMKHVTSISIGCGLHAGDPHVMRKTVQFSEEVWCRRWGSSGLPRPDWVRKKKVGGYARRS